MNTTEVNQMTVLETKEFLIEIIKNPADYKLDLELIKVLRSQSSLAKFELKERNISPCSLNTLKSASESLLNGGFQELDELRLNARNAIEGAIIGSKANKRTRTGLIHKVEELKKQLSIVEKTNFLLSSLVDELRGELKEMAFSTNNQQQIDKYREMNKRIEAKLSYTIDGEA